MSVSRTTVRLIATFVASGALVGAAALPALAAGAGHDRDGGRAYSHSRGDDRDRDGRFGDHDRDRDRGWHRWDHDRDRDRGWHRGWDRRWDRRWDRDWDRDRGWHHGRR